MEVTQVPVNRKMDKEDVVYTIKYYSGIKRMKFCHLQQYGWIENILFSEVSQRQILYDIAYIWS